MAAIGPRVGRVCLFLWLRGTVGSRRWLRIIHKHGLGAANIEEFRHFHSVIRQYNASGERFRIDSHCQSACTMFLSIRNVCVEPRAELLFHAGGDRGKGIISPSITHQMLSTYNAALRRYVTANHFMDKLEFHSISGSEIISRFGYRACR